MSGNSIKVVCRFRPQNALENREGGTPIIDIGEDGTQVALKVKSPHFIILPWTPRSNAPIEQGKDFQGSFTFDKVFGMNTPQQDVFQYSIKSIVDGTLCTLYPSGTSYPDSCFLYCRRYCWLQRHCLCLWSNRLWKDFHYDGKYRDSHFCMWCPCRSPWSSWYMLTWLFFSGRWHWWRENKGHHPTHCRTNLWQHYGGTKQPWIHCEGVVYGNLYGKSQRSFKS